MSQSKVFTWTNPNPVVVHNIDVGFEANEITIVDTTNGGSWYWNSAMADGSVLDVDAGTIAAANGVTPLQQDAVYGATITGFTNATPGVLTVNDTATFGFAIGDTVSVVQIADDATGVTLNGLYTVAGVTATTITMVESTAALSVYVSGGIVLRLSDIAGNIIPSENHAIQGLRLDTAAVSIANAVMTAVVRGQMNVT